MADESHDKLIAATVSALRARWRSVKARLIRGHWQPAEKGGCYDCFEADTTARQRTLARRFYSIQHADKLLSLSNDVLRANISGFSEPAVFRVWEEYPDQPASQRNYMRSLVKHEYVLIEYGGVSSFPKRVLYDDWDERSVGARCSYQGMIMKSTGEPFSPTEAEWLDSSVQETTWQDSDFWQSYTYHEAKNQIHVWLDPLCDEDYLESLDMRLQQASKHKVVAMLHFLRDRVEDPSVKSEIGQLLVNFGRRAKSELVEQTGRIFSSNTVRAPRCLVAADEFMTKNW